MRWRWAGGRKRKATSGKGRWRRSGGISPQEQCGISPDDRYRRGSQWWPSCFTASCKAVERQEGKKGWVGGEIFDVGFFPADTRNLTQRSLRSERGKRGEFLMLDVIFLIGEEIVHAKSAKDAKEFKM